MLIITLGSSKFFVGFSDAGQVCLLEEQEKLTSIVFQRLAELDREIHEETKHNAVGSDPKSIEKALAYLVSANRGAVTMIIHFVLPVLPVHQIDRAIDVPSKVCEDVQRKNN